MSTKVTISHNEKYHLYTECFEDGLVYACVYDPVMFKADTWEGSASSVTIALSKKDMRKLCKEFLEKDPTVHNRQEE